jgi:hypothetical protein
MGIPERAVSTVDHACPLLDKRLFLANKKLQNEMVPIPQLCFVSGHDFSRAIEARKRVGF